METKTTKKEEESVARHCAYCLNLCGFPAKICGGCKKRAYCSKDCQVKDWSSKGNGQRHVNWCQRHECGEEDIDWEVVPIPNKGLGIRAKKLIPSGLKIIVEPTFSSPYAHPGIKDLCPEGAPLLQRFAFNTFLGEFCLGEDKQPDSQTTVTLRIARVNHACQPNAATIYDETAHVAILFAQKDIQPGEEISICYYFPFFFLAPGVHSNVEEELRFLKNSMSSHYGVTCSTDCFCYDPSFHALVLEGRQLYETVEALTYQFKVKEALEAGDKLLDIYRRLNLSWEYLGRAEFSLFQIAIQKSEFVPRAKEYIRSATELFGKICPYSERLTKKYEKMLQHPEEQSNYLLMD